MFSKSMNRAILASLLATAISLSPSMSRDYWSVYGRTTSAEEGPSAAPGPWPLPRGSRRQLGEQLSHHDHAPVELFDAELLVRRVRVVIGQPQAAQQARGAELGLEGVDHRDGAALAD